MDSDLYQPLPHTMAKGGRRTFIIGCGATAFIKVTRKSSSAFTIDNEEIRVCNKKKKTVATGNGKSLDIAKILHTRFYFLYDRSNHHENECL